MRAVSAGQSITAAGHKPDVGVWGCPAGIRQDLPCTCISQTALPRHCSPSFRCRSYPAPLPSATAGGPTFISAIKNHMKVHLSPYNRKTHYIFCRTEYLALCATHTMWIPSPRLSTSSEMQIGNSAPYTKLPAGLHPLRLCSLLLTPLAPPTTAILKLQCLIETEHFLTVVSLYYSTTKKSTWNGTRMPLNSFPDISNAISYHKIQQR